MGNLSYRELTRTVGETDATGQTTRDEKVWEYGAEIDGVFVRVGTFTEGQVADARNRADAERERGGDAQAGGTQPQQSQQAGGAAPPNEETPASEARTGDATG